MEKENGYSRKVMVGCSLLLLLPLLLLVTIILLNQLLPRDLTPYDAHYNTEKWVGHQVRVTGWLRLFQGSTGPHFGVEDEEKNRVGVRGFDENTLKSLLDRRVRVEGEFHFDEIYGIYVVARKVEVIP